MRVDLLKHNQEAYEKVQKAIKEGKKKIAISHATGTGKSYLVAKLFEDFSNDKKLVLVPSSYIRDQIQGLFEKYNIQNVDVILYQKLIKMSDEDIAAMDYDVIALDEYHHDTSKVWGNKVRTLIDTHSETIIFGTSATPIRSDGVNTIDELFEGNCASDLPLSESIAKKIVPLPKYVGAMYMLDDELERLRKKVEQATNTKEEKQEFYKTIDSMGGQIEKSYGMPIILNKHIKDKEGKYLVFCKKKRHLQEIKETVIGWFRTAGCKNINAYEVYSDYENKDAEYKAFCEDTSHDLKLMFCVHMLNEGLHLENISGVLLLRPTRSSIVWHQQIGRAIEANNTNTPVIIDAVNNFSAVGQGMELLKEIKDAVAREKESDPDFDNSGLADIDTFFVLEQVVEIQEMFKEIEGRLRGSWDAMFKEYCKFYEENGHGDVPKTEEYRELNLWCRVQRSNLISGTMNKDREKLLKVKGFILNLYKYRFEKNIKDVANYYEKYERFPSGHSSDFSIKKLGSFFESEKIKMRNKNYKKWKKEIINLYLPEFSYELQSDKAFMNFIYYAKLYKEKYATMNIKNSDVIDGYHIGTALSEIKKKNKNGKLSAVQKEELNSIGIYLGNKLQQQFDSKMKLAKLAVNDGIIINNNNQIYNKTNLYTWITTTVKSKYQNNELSNEDSDVIATLVNKPLNQYFNKGSFINVVDVIENKEIIYKSYANAAKEIQGKFGLNVSSATICNRLNSKNTTPYKGRFIFYYATDEEVKKYLEENKTSQF